MAAISQRTRPVHWDEVVGQEHVKDVLRPALERGRIGHAYLFSGPRGVGKTTTARLIAMTVNCEHEGGAVKPCGQCESCRMVMNGRHPDVLEIDAASNNSVDDVRDLREKVALQPMRGSHKVYILDEAHMMSKSAFNALLKTLEEPPQHAVFILATTEPERLPPTILSRCQHYRFRRHSATEISGKLQKICDAEGVNAAAEALNLMARSADGAMRDGESLLERMLAAGEPALTLEMVEGALGLPPQERLQVVAVALVNADSSAVLNGLNALYADGFAPRTITERVKVTLRDLLHQQLGVGGARVSAERLDEALLLKLIRALDEEDHRFARASDLIALEMAFTKALVVAQGLESGGGEAGLAARVVALEKQLRDGLKAPAARLSVPEFDPMARGQRAAKPAPESAPTSTASANLEAAPFEDDREPAPNRAFVQEYETRKTPAPSNPAKTAATRVAASSGGKTWGDVVTRAKPQLKAFLREASAELGVDTLTLKYGPKHKWHAEQVARHLEELGALTREVLGAEMALELVMPDGSKKNSSGNALTPVPQAPTAVAEVVSAVIAEVKAAPLAAPEPAAPDPIPVTPAARASLVPAERQLAPEVMALGFQQLGQDDPEQSLFGAQTYVALSEAPVLIETPIPPLEPMEQQNLETLDLASATEQLPLEAFGLDFGDISAPVRPRGPSAPSSLTGHPNYAVMAKLFAHRVREAGRFERPNSANSADETEAVAPNPASATLEDTE